MESSRRKSTLLRVLRANPIANQSPYYQEYEIPEALAEQNTVLSLLQYVYDNIDHTLAFRGPCNRGVCGSCTMKINGRPGLSCMRRANGELTIEPLAKLLVIRDLVVDMQTRKKPSGR